MVITFAQYSILTATYKCATYREVEQKTSFDRLMLDYYIMGLLNIGLINAVEGSTSEAPYYELTELGVNTMEEYEQANPDLIIKRTTYDTNSL